MSKDNLQEEYDTKIENMEYIYQKDLKALKDNTPQEVKCKHNNVFAICKLCFEEIYGKVDPKSKKRVGFNLGIIGQKSGGKW